ncbi:MAG TPA: glycosyltransferase family 2 protein [Pyrinomonadaceae bacterium]|nr:glycosyltransferase family 2 protein [Pyrinomonadaceae bacterium]
MHFSLSAFALLVVAAWGAVLLWLAGAVLTLRGIYRQRPLAPPDDARLTDDRAPFVSVLVPARNEEHRVLEESVRSMLAQDYGRFEVVAVNDRSTDATGPILRSIAAEDARLRVVEGVEPPEGWLGKPHAMRQALDNARGEWVLATDADMLFEPAALRASMARALDARLDAVTLLPQVVCLSFWERVFMPTFGWFMLLARPLERVNDPRRRSSCGSCRSSSRPSSTANGASPYVTRSPSRSAMPSSSPSSSTRPRASPRGAASRGKADAFTNARACARRADAPATERPGRPLTIEKQGDKQFIYVLPPHVNTTQGATWRGVRSEHF